MNRLLILLIALPMTACPTGSQECTLASTAHQVNESRVTITQGVFGMLNSVIDGPCGGFAVMTGTEVAIFPIDSEGNLRTGAAAGRTRSDDAGQYQLGVAPGLYRLCLDACASNPSGEGCATDAGPVAGHCTHVELDIGREEHSYVGGFSHTGWGPSENIGTSSSSGSSSSSFGTSSSAATSSSGASSG